MAKSSELFKVGDIITFAGVRAVNRRTLLVTSRRRQFVVIKECCRTDLIKQKLYYPETVTEGPYKTVNRTPTMKDRVVRIMHG